MTKTHGHLERARNQLVKFSGEENAFAGYHLELCCSAKRFVNALHHYPEAAEQLQTRATFIERRCGPESPFAVALNEAISPSNARRSNTDIGHTHHDPENGLITNNSYDIKRLTSWNVAFERLRSRFSGGLPRLDLTRIHIEREMRGFKLESDPIKTRDATNPAGSAEANAVHSKSVCELRFLSELDDILLSIERVLDDPELDLHPKERTAWERCRRMCTEIQREADSVEVDGCWLLYNVHKYEEKAVLNTPDVAAAIFSGGNLELVQAAADSMVDWVAVNRTAVDPPVASEKGKKRKRSTERGEARMKLNAALTTHHDYSNGGCSNLEHIGNNALARLAGVSQSAAHDFFKVEFGGHKKYKNAYCCDPPVLVAALKKLNNEYTVDSLFGRRPPDEDDRDDGE